MLILYTAQLAIRLGLVLLSSTRLPTMNQSLEEFQTKTIQQLAAFLEEKDIGEDVLEKYERHMSHNIYVYYSTGISLQKLIMCIIIKVFIIFLVELNENELREVGKR